MKPQVSVMKGGHDIVATKEAVCSLSAGMNSLDTRGWPVILTSVLKEKNPDDMKRYGYRCEEWGYIILPDLTLQVCMLNVRSSHIGPDGKNVTAGLGNMIMEYRDNRWVLVELT